MFIIQNEKNNDDECFDMENEMNRSTGTINPLSEDDDGKVNEVDGPPSGLVWNGDEWMSSSYVQRNAVLKRQKSKEIGSIEEEQEANFSNDCKDTNLEKNSSFRN